jgi:hypothetical protein
LDLLKIFWLLSSFPLEDPPKPGGVVELGNMFKQIQDNWDRTGFNEPIYGISWGFHGI